MSRASQSVAYTLKRNRAEFLLVFSVFLLGFVFYLWIFSRNQLIPMTDGPYYLIQLRSILTTGGLAYGDPPLTFYLLALFSILLGDITLGVKVGVSFFCAFATIPMYFFMKRIGKSVLSGSTAMLLVIFSAQFIRMLTDYMKNAVGICWLIAFIYYLHDLAIHRIRKSSLVLATFFLVLSGLTHVLDFGVALLFLAFYTVEALFLNINRRSFLKAVGIMALAIGAFVFIASTFFGSLFTDFSKVLSFLYDLTRQGRSRVSAPNPRPAPTVTSLPSAPAPVGPVNVFSVGGGLGITLLVLFVGAVLSFYAWKGKEKEGFLLLTSATIVGSIVCFPLIPEEWLSRFLLMIVVPTAIILSYGVSKIWRRNVVNSKFFALAVSLFCVLFFVAQSFNVAMSIRPTVDYAGYLDLVNMKTQISSNSIVAIPDHSIRYWVEYVDEVDITQTRFDQLPQDLWRSYSHVFGLFPKRQPPQVPFKTVYVGNVFVLAELKQNK